MFHYKIVFVSNSMRAMQRSFPEFEHVASQDREGGPRCDFSTRRPVTGANPTPRRRAGQCAMSSGPKRNQPALGGVAEDQFLLN